MVLLKRDLPDYGLKFVNLDSTLIYFAGLAVIILPVYIIFSKTKKTQQRFPGIRVAHWDIKLQLINAGSIFLFCLSYELLFRGILLFECVRAFGAWPAIFISTAIYVCAHLPHKFLETLGSISPGILRDMIPLCLDWFTLYFNPWMSFVPKWSLVKK